MNNIYVNLLLLLGVAIIFWRLTAKKRREKYIESYIFSKELKEKLSREFNVAQREEIFEGLREYFSILNRANNVKFFVPSVAILKAWREFSSLENYKEFSKKAFGIIILPPKKSKKIAKKTLQNAVKTMFSLAAKKEGIDSKNDRKLPYLFKLDDVLKVANGTKYQFKRKNSRRAKSRKRANSKSTDYGWYLWYSSDEYWECNVEIGSMNFSISNEDSLDEYEDYSSENSNSSSSSSHDANSSLSSSTHDDWGSSDSSSSDD